jgi:hypothetical protein
MKDISVVIAPRNDETRLLMADSLGDLMIAKLGPLSQAQPDSVRLLLEALAIWHRSRLRVVVCAECEPQLASTGLTDGFGFGVDTLHYRVDVIHREHRRRWGRGRLRGLGDFSVLRRDLREEPIFR